MEDEQEIEVKKVGGVVEVKVDGEWEKLSTRERKFAELCARNLYKTNRNLMGSAYREISGSKGNDGTVQKEGERIHKRVRVQKYIQYVIDKLCDDLQKMTSYGRMEAFKEMCEVYKVAEMNNSPSAMLETIKAKIKLLGLEQTEQKVLKIEVSKEAENVGSEIIKYSEGREGAGVIEDESRSDRTQIGVSRPDGDARRLDQEGMAKEI